MFSEQAERANIATNESAVLDSLLYVILFIVISQHIIL
nr:Putative uncharacterized protein [Moritella viscosa]SHO03994.1 Putative uncharacterized protein [Moritella viscosa]SHO17337.1 Putative uncharacterized protein [Moritella viscosa]